MKTYYKATRPDGTDFHTGTVDYAGHLETGKPLKRITSDDGLYSTCTDTVYHASDVPAEALIGGTWPCRLFTVTGKPVAQEGHKYGFRSLRVTGEIESWQALGPNGVEVAALIERASRLTADEAEALDGVWDTALDTAWDAARDTARRAAWDAARDTARRAARGAAWYAVPDAALGGVWDAAWGAARDTAWGAVAAQVVKDLIATEQFDALYGPWRSVMEG